MGGKDAASPRYVFTKLENITRCIFHPNDDYLVVVVVVFFCRYSCCFYI